MSTLKAAARRSTGGSPWRLSLPRSASGRCWELTATRPALGLNRVSGATDVTLAFLSVREP